MRNKEARDNSTLPRDVCVHLGIRVLILESEEESPFQDKTVLTSVFFLFIYYFIVHTLMFSVGNVENTE